MISLPSTQHRNEQYVVAVKGAPDMVLGPVQSLPAHGRYVSTPDGRAPAHAHPVCQRRHDPGCVARPGGGLQSQPELMPDISDLEKLEEGLIFVGLVGMIDPARPEVAPALAKATSAGIRTIMITGDYPNTARAIAETIGLLQPGHQVLTGAELDDMTDEQLQRAGGILLTCSPESHQNTSCASWKRCVMMVRWWR